MHIHFVCRHQFADILHIDSPSVLPFLYILIGYLVVIGPDKQKKFM